MTKPTMYSIIRLFLTILLTALSIWSVYNLKFALFMPKGYEILEPIIVFLFLLLIGETGKSAIDYSETTNTIREENDRTRTQLINMHGITREQVIKSLKGSLIENVGNSQSAAIRIIESLKTAQHVNNTWVSWLSSTFYQAGTEVTVKNAHVEAIKRGVLWFDILSINNKSRAENIIKKCGNTGYTHHYIPAEFKDFPFINMILIEHNQSSENSRELFYGWGTFQGIASGDVFRTTDPEIIALFEEYFCGLQQLCQKSEMVRYEAEGWWINIAYADDKTVVNVAVIKIETDALLIRGYTFNADGSFSGAFTSRAARFEGEKLWFVYQKEVPGGDDTFHGAQYIFQRSSPNGKYIDFEGGFFYEKENKRLNTLGTKLNASDCKIVEGIEIMRKPTEQFKIFLAGKIIELGGRIRI